MQLQRIIAPAAALGAALFTLLPAGEVVGFSKLGRSLNAGQRDFRVHNNFTRSTTNDNVIPSAQFPGTLGAEQAIWKGAVEWGSSAHGDGTGDPTQPVLGDGGADFDPFWAGNASAVGNSGTNIVSQIGSCSGGVLAFAEASFGGGWRIRFCGNQRFDDGPGNIGNRFDLQGIMTHEYGHALGLGHSGTGAATMAPSGSPGQTSLRSIHPDDIAGVQCIYGLADPAKPVISGLSVSAGDLTITGSGFDALDNEIWFTNGSTTSALIDPIVRVSNVASSGAGTQITVTIPLGAGPGDVAVKLPGGLGGSTLSNAYPSDLGQVPLPLAAAVFRNGGGTNTSCLTSATLPVLGQTWDIQVDGSGHPGITLTSVFCHLLPSSGTFINGGEVLIDLSSPRCFRTLKAATGGVDVHSLAVPADASLLGLTSSVQGVLLGGGVELCNAEDTVLGV